MNRMINEKDISSTIQDFETLCFYILENKLALTPGGALGKKACFDLNGQMIHPAPDAKITNQMNKYPSIALYLNIALETRLLEPSIGARQKAALIATESYGEFQKMSEYTKYLFILLGWMRYINTDKLYGNATNMGWFDTSLIQEIIEQAGNTQPSDAVFKRKERYEYFRDSPIERLMNECTLLSHHLRDLGLVGYHDEDIEKLYGYKNVINKAWFTELGAIISVACSTRRFSWINYLTDDCVFDDGDEIEIYENDFEQNPPGSAGFLEPFVSCFPDNEIDAEIINKFLFPQLDSQPDDLVYEFRVSFGRGCYREISCGGYCTFESLHLAIQYAFDFDNDHLYEFFLDGNRWSRQSIKAPNCSEPPFADEILICDARLRVKQRILYLFDFGDRWMFDVKLLSINKSEDVPKHPIITKSVGESPEQYPTYDDDYDEEWDEE